MTEPEETKSVNDHSLPQMRSVAKLFWPNDDSRAPNAGTTETSTQHAHKAALTIQPRDRNKQANSKYYHRRHHYMLAKSRLAGVSFVILALSACSLGKVADESNTVRVKPKSYEAAAGTWASKYLNQNIREEPARFVAVRSDNGRLEELRIGTDNGTHWNIYSCKTDGTRSFLYEISEDGEKTGAAEVDSRNFCHFSFEKGGGIDLVTVTNKQVENSARDGFRACPSNIGCYRYTVNTRWEPVNSTEPIPDAQQMEEIRNTRMRLREEQRQEDSERKWAEAEIDDLKARCRMGLVHWTQCPDE